MILTRNLQVLGENSVSFPLFSTTNHTQICVGLKSDHNGEWTLDREIHIPGAKYYLLLVLNAECLKKC
jgi:hypothetical protein